MAQDSDASRGSDPYNGDFKGGGLRLSGLKQWRESRGLSQGQLAKLVGVPRHYVQRIEQGRRGCNPWVAQKMAEDNVALNSGPAGRRRSLLLCRRTSRKPEYASAVRMPYATPRPGLRP